MSGRDEQPDSIIKYCDCSEYPLWHLQKEKNITLIWMSSPEHLIQYHQKYGDDANLAVIHVREARWSKMSIDKLLSYVTVIRCPKCFEKEPIEKKKVFYNFIKKHWEKRTIRRI